MADGDGYGQQDPTDELGVRNPILFMIAQELGKLDTIKVVKVVSVDTGTKTVSVIPLVQQTDGNYQVTDQIQIYGIPYMPWQYGINAVLADPAVDDIGLLLCSDRDISAVLSTKAAAPPGSSRRYDRADGIYLGGLLNPDAQQFLKFTDDGMQWQDKNSNTITSSASGIALVTPSGQVTINGLPINSDGQIAGALPVTGALQLGDAIEALDGSEYAGDIKTTGNIFAADVKSGSGATLVTLRGHQHTGNNLPPNPGH